VDCWRGNHGKRSESDLASAVRTSLRHRSELIKLAAQHVQHMQRSLTQMNLAPWAPSARMMEKAPRTPAAWMILPDPRFPQTALRAWMMAVRVSFPIPVPFSEWVTSAEHYWVTFWLFRSFGAGKRPKHFAAKMF
jgi:hypothetical protein